MTPEPAHPTLPQPPTRGSSARTGRYKRRAGAVAVIAAAALGAGFVPVPGTAAPAVMPSREIAVGMTGVGKTVVIGTQVVDFQVRVLGVLRNAGPAGNLILFRASGPVIRRVGGIAAGMSGSPIYLAGRLAGALSYTFRSADPTVGLFTPIEDMLRVLPPARAHPGAAPDASHAYAVGPLRLDGRTIRRVIVEARSVPFGPRRNAPVSGAWIRSLRDQGHDLLRVPGSDTLVAVPAATPLFVSGMGGAGLDSLSHALMPMGLMPMAGGAQAGLPASLPLVPGSAIGVALLQGDIAAYAIGTMTYRDGNRMLAFGHPFTGIGPSSYLLTNATIFQIVRGQQQNIKVGAAGSPVGIVSQDRPAGISGLIGVLPRMFGVHVHVTDSDTDAARDFNFQVIPSTEIAPLVVPIGSQGAIERALNRTGQGTARVRMVLYGRSLPHPVVRENMFYGADGIAARALAELPQAMRLLFDNDFTDLGPMAIDLDVHVTSAQETATIVSAEAPPGPVHPGDTVSVRVTLRPFRAAPETHDIALRVPEDAAPGPALLIVRAGGLGLVGTGPAGIVPAAVAGQGAGPRTLDDAIQAFETRVKNTDVVVQLMGGLPAHPATGSASPSKRSAQWTTPWVMRGRVQILIVIKPADRAGDPGGPGSRGAAVRRVLIGGSH